MGGGGGGGEEEQATLCLEVYQPARFEVSGLGVDVGVWGFVRVVRFGVWVVKSSVRCLEVWRTGFGVWCLGVGGWG